MEGLGDRFGAWAIGGSWGPQSEDESVAALHTALDLGCNFIDTAQGYGDGRSERVIAKVLAERNPGAATASTSPPRSRPSRPATGRRSPYDRIEDRYPETYLRERLERSLRDLKTDCIDLVQLHTWTRAWNRDPVAAGSPAQVPEGGQAVAASASARPSTTRTR